MPVLGSYVSRVWAVDLYLELLKSIKGWVECTRLKLQTNYTKVK